MKEGKKSAKELAEEKYEKWFSSLESNQEENEIPGQQEMVDLVVINSLGSKYVASESSWFKFKDLEGRHSALIKFLAKLYVEKRIDIEKDFDHPECRDTPASYAKTQIRNIFLASKKLNGGTKRKVNEDKFAGKHLAFFPFLDNRIKRLLKEVKRTSSEKLKVILEKELLLLKGIKKIWQKQYKSTLELKEKYEKIINIDIGLGRRLWPVFFEIDCFVQRQGMDYFEEYETAFELYNIREKEIKNLRREVRYALNRIEQLEMRIENKEKKLGRVGAFRLTKEELEEKINKEKVELEEFNIITRNKEEDFRKKIEKSVDLEEQIDWFEITTINCYLEDLKKWRHEENVA